MNSKNKKHLDFVINKFLPGAEVSYGVNVCFDSRVERFEAVKKGHKIEVEDGYVSVGGIPVRGCLGVSIYKTIVNSATR